MIRTLLLFALLAAGASAGTIGNVFFGLGVESLTVPQKKHLIPQLARLADTSAIVVTGYADSSGNAEDNAALAAVRANNVAYELVLNGVDPSKITVVAAGETNQLPTTARRVSITK